MHPVDLYCERISPGLLAEPFNSASNAAFFVAAWLLWRFARANGSLSAATWLLILLVATIGAGSTLFHLFATEETRGLDLLPILVFQLVFLWCYARCVMRQGACLAAALVTVLLGLSLYARQYPMQLNGSLTYAPALLAVLAIAAYHSARDLAGGGEMLLASGLLAASLFFRTVDLAVCDWLPVGTHFIWHLLNGAVLYLCVRGLLRVSDLRSAAMAIADNRR